MGYIDILNMSEKLSAQEILEEHEKRNMRTPGDNAPREVTVFEKGFEAVEKSEHILETIFAFIEKHYEMLANLSIQQWLTIKNHFSQLYESITLLVLILETAKNIPSLLIKEFSLFVSHIIHQKLPHPVTPEDFKLYKKESLFYGKAQEMLKKYPHTEKQVVKLYKKQLDERLLLTHRYMTGILKIRMNTQTRLTGISAPYNQAALDSELFRQDLDNTQKTELKNNMTKMAHSSFDFIRSTKVFLQYAYATEKENFKQSTETEGLSGRVIFYAGIDTENAFNYLEQAKSALFLERLSFRTGFPGGINEDEINHLLDREQTLKKELENIFLIGEVEGFSTVEKLSKIRKELDGIYQQLNQFSHPQLKDYINLRRALSIDYRDMQKTLLQ